MSQAWVNQDEMFDSNLVRKVLDTVPYIVSRTADSDEHDAATAKLERSASLCRTWDRRPASAWVTSMVCGFR